MSFTDSFIVGGKNLGSAMTVGSGVPANTLYEATKQVGKIYVGPNTATAAPAGGYVQGTGHSAFSTALGLSADNAFGMSFQGAPLAVTDKGIQNLRLL